MKTFLTLCKVSALALTTITGVLLSAMSLSAPPEIKIQNSHKTLILTLQYSHNEYEVLNARVLNEKIPARFLNGAKADLLAFHLKNSLGQILGQGKITNPHVLRGILQEHHNEQTHGEKTLQDSTFMVRFPYVEGMQVLGLLEPSQPSSSRARSGTLPAPLTHNLSFSNLL